MKTSKSNIIGVIAIVLVVIAIIGFNFQTLRQHKDLQSVESNIYSWGSNGFGQIGGGAFGENLSDKVSVKLPDAGKIVDIGTGLNFTVGLDDRGTVWGWGSNRYGQLGDGTNSNQRINAAKVQGLPIIKDIAVSQNHVLALSDTGTVWSWGHNLSGELGIGDNDDRNTPVEVKGLPVISKISAGYRFSLVLGKDDSLWGWGGKCQPKDTNGFKDFIESFAQQATVEGGYADPDGGDITSINQYNDCVGEDYLNIKTNKPFQFTGVTDIKDISTGFGHILVLRNDGTVWSTGCNKYAQVGVGRIGNTDENKLYQQVKGIDHVQAISAGFRHSLVLKDDGTVWGWGHNMHGQLGLGDTGDIIEPIQMKNLKNIKMISAGHDFSIALDNNGVLWGTGENNYNLLGLNSPDRNFKIEAVQLGTFKNVKEIKAGGGHIVVLS